MDFQCFMVEDSGRHNRYLRRYRSGKDERCPADGPDVSFSYCHAKVFIGVFYTEYDEDGYSQTISPSVYDDDPRWPDRCEACGKPFLLEDNWQVFTEELYRAEDGREWGVHDLPHGAMYDAKWLHDVERYVGPDGRALICVVPNHHPWMIDGQATNCTRPGEPHKCWIRHGEPPLLTVDKAGDTCSAGAGSIQTKEWHGFLRGGVLVEC